MHHIHALHIPEITGLIVSFLTWKDLLLCRGVSHGWRAIFSPHLHLSAVYWKQDPSAKLALVRQLDSLGPWVDSLKVVYPFAEDLNIIRRSCTTLTHIGFFSSVRDSADVDIDALQHFLTSMQTIESIDIFSHNDLARRAILYCLATYAPPPIPRPKPPHPLTTPSTLSLASEAPSWRISTDTHPSTHTQPPWATYPSKKAAAATVNNSGSLKRLKIEHGGHSMKVALLQWEHVEAVLARNQTLTHLHLQEAIVRTGAELEANPEEEILQWTQQDRLAGSMAAGPAAIGGLASAAALYRRFSRFIDRLASLTRRTTASAAMATTEATATLAEDGRRGLRRRRGARTRRRRSHETQKDWDDATTLFSDPFEGSWETLPFLPIPPQVVFSNIKSIILHQINMTKELYSSLLSRCPLLTHLEVTGTGTFFHTRSGPAISWWDWLEHCPLLESVVIDQGAAIDVRDIWARLPSTLWSFTMYGLDWTMDFADIHRVIPMTIPADRMTYPGATLTRLHLETTQQHLGDPPVHYIMHYCRSLRSLFLGVRAYHVPNTVEPYGAFPEWACGQTLRSLEIKTSSHYREVPSLRTILAFVSRMADLKVLEKVTLPLPFMADLYRSTRGSPERAALSPPLLTVRKMTLKAYRECPLWKDNLRWVEAWMPCLDTLSVPNKVYDRHMLDALRDTPL
ncbi:hypothetical protein BGZ94_001799 [Podila epigama]|nr:hypothetical protein BGZ94_001799 [Podila epigama]